MPPGLPPIDNEIPPYLMPRGIQIAAQEPANDPNWSVYAVLSDPTDHILAARGVQQVRLDLSATTMVGGVHTATYDSAPGQIFGNLHLGGGVQGPGSSRAMVYWASFIAYFILLRDVAGYENRLRGGGSGLTAGALFGFAPSDIGSGGPNDFEGTFSYPGGASVPFVAFSTGDPVTSASITASII